LSEPTALTEHPPFHISDKPGTEDTRYPFFDGLAGENETFQGRNELDSKPKAERKMWVVFGAHVFAWFSYGFMLRLLDTPTRHVSSWVPLGLAAGAVYSIVVGLVMRRKFFAVPTDGVAVDSSRVLNRWRVGNFTGFACATTITLLGFALKILGSTWLLPGIFFGVGLGFLLLWRPRPLPFG
jgi:hypothetical protein